MNSTPVWSIDARSGDRRARISTETGPDELDRAVRAAAACASALTDRTRRAHFLRAAADRLAARAAELIEQADAETALGTVRLSGELTRTRDQLLAFAEQVDAAEFLDVVIDHGDPGAQPPAPDLRRYKIPLGAVAVYAASNFPFAFSVAGGDTASALAAGCPVVVKAHPGHPATAEATVAALREAAEAAGLPPGVVGLVHGFDAGVWLIGHPAVAAAGFTGSVRGGRALYDAAAARPRPIPFHGELGSLNPVVVTPAAAAERADDIAAGLAGSMTLGHGQFCTKPGLVLLPAGADGDRVLESVRTALADTAPGVPLDDRIRAAYVHGVRERCALPAVTTLGPAPVTGEHRVPATAVQIDARELAGAAHAPLFEECFGPFTVLVRYREPAEIDAVLEPVAGTLTATVQLARAEASDPERAAPLLARLTRIAGRVIVDGWPTGVAVSPAQHHGGPYPAATSPTTSVGAAAIERWLRPVTFQNTPDPLLPPELREANPLGVPRRIRR